MPRFLRYVILCTVLTTGFPGISLAADLSTVPTDVELIKGAIGDEIRSILPRLPLNRGDRVTLEPKTDRKNNWMVQDALTQTLLEEGYQVVRAPSDSNQVQREEPRYTLLFRIAEIWLNYTYRKGWFRAKTIHRESGATFSLTLTAPPDGTVIWAQQIHARTDDVVPAKADRLLGDATVLSRTVLDKKSRWLEGIVVLGLVTGFVYLSF